MNEESRWRQAFNSQRKKAAIRGIGWELTYQQWRDWWGDDIYQRGIGTSKLCMQRIGDLGPYALDNIRKGYPVQNCRTRGAATTHARSLRVASEIAAATYAAPTIPSHEPEEPSDLAELGYRTCEVWM